jgi:hypothetical protein
MISARGMAKKPRLLPGSVPGPVTLPVQPVMPYPRYCREVEYSCNSF